MAAEDLVGKNVIVVANLKARREASEGATKRYI